MSKKIYLAGKVSGLPMAEASMKFGLKEKQLTEQGHTVINPLNIVNRTDDWNTCMKKCIPAMLECDEVHLLPCWKDSPGATFEKEVASRLSIPIVFH
jgi:hypothetical protein